jgi:hypothetical protein
MADAMLSNYQCPNCRAKLLLKRRAEPKKPREEALCPYCLMSGKELARCRTLRLGPSPVPPHKNHS